MEKFKDDIIDNINEATKELDITRLDIRKKLEDLKNSQNFDNDDVRIYYLENISSILLETIIAYKLSFELKSSDWWEKNFSEYTLNSIPGKISNFQKNSIMNLLYTSYSITEDTYRQLIKIVNPTVCNNGKAAFGSIYPCLLKELQTQYDDSIFKLYRLARNCQHNNGFYYPENNTNSQDVVYRNITYHFPYGQKVFYKDGLPLTKLLIDLAKLHLDMCDSPKLKAIKFIKHANTF